MKKQHNWSRRFASGRVQGGKSTLAKTEECLLLFRYHYVSKLVESYALFCYDNIKR